MSEFSRRQFLKQLGLFATTLALSPNILANSDAFEMLVVGDSLIWGQGLNEKDKFYSLVRNWLETQVKREVKLKVKAHSGATIFLHDKYANLLKNAGKDEYTNIAGEVPIAFPTISKQIENAKAEYQKAEDVNLVMLTGGIVDITVAEVLNPSGNNDELIRNITKYCFEDMSKFLEQSAQIFPNALFVVVGYFPIMADNSKSSEILNAYLEASSFPALFKPLINNLLGQQLFKGMKKKALARSRIWFDNSNLELEKSVNRLNEKFGKKRAVFVKTNLTENEATHTPNTLLFKMVKKGKINDFVYKERESECKETLNNLKKEIGYKESLRQCEIAAIGHPNIEGSKRYAESIINKLKEIY